MRHRKKKQNTLNKGLNQKRSLVERGLLTNLIRYGKLKTSSKKAWILKAKADSFFSSLVSLINERGEKDGRREAIRRIKATVFGEKEGKKVIDELLPKFMGENKTSSFVGMYKMGTRKGDGAEEVLIKLI